MKKLTVLIILFASACLAYAQNNGAYTPAAAGSVYSIVLPDIRTDLRDGEGKTAVMNNCGSCHSHDYITMQPKLSKAQWSGIVVKMIKVFGAPIKEDDAAAIKDYLGTAYGSGK